MAVQLTAESGTDIFNLHLDYRVQPVVSKPS